MKIFIKKNGNFKSVLIFVFLGVLIIVALNFFEKPLKNFFYLISSPIQKNLWQAGDKMSDFFETIFEIKNLKKENEELKLKIQSLLAENATLKELKNENETLRKALNLGLEKEFKLVLAEVIGKDISQDSLIINKGKIDGLLKGFPVITEEKILVGKIQEVYENFSRVMLLTHKESSFDIKILEKNISALVKGKGNFILFLDFIPKEAEISLGDKVISSAMGGIFPEGLLVGEIKEIKKSDLEPFQKAKISPFFDIKELKYLFIITRF